MGDFTDDPTVKKYITEGLGAKLKMKTLSAAGDFIRPVCRYAESHYGKMKDGEVWNSDGSILKCQEPENLQGFTETENTKAPGSKSGHATSSNNII